MKRILSLLFILQLALQLYAKVEVDGIYYNLDEKNHTAEMTSGSYSGDLVIPSTITYNDITYTVTSIGREACYYSRSTIMSVKLPNTIKVISTDAFSGLKNLTSIEIPNSVTSIGLTAFSGCDNLAEVKFGSSLKYIGQFAFSNCKSLKKIVIPRSVESIAKRAFGDCYGLTDVKFEDSPVDIGENAFQYCSRLVNLDLGNSIKSLGTSAFYNCSALEEVELPNSLTSMAGEVFWKCVGLKKVILPNSIKVIPWYSFAECTSLQSIEIPNSVESISSYAFYKCSNLSSLTIPYSVTTMSDYAFKDCSNLASITNQSTTPQSITSLAFPDSKNTILYVHKNSYEDYANSTGWKDFKAIFPYDAPIDLEDATVYKNITVNVNCDIDYTRNYKNNSMQALFVPFEMSYEDWADQFDVYTINCMAEFDSDKDEIMDKLYLYVEKVTEGKTLRANYPYLIKAKEAGVKTISLHNTTLFAADNLHTIECSTMKYSYTFIGTYNTVTNMADMGAYAIAGGVPKQAGSNSATLAPYRWYMLVNKKESQFANEDTPQNLEVKIQDLEDEEEETTIDIANNLTLPLDD